MPALKSLLMLLAITVVGAGAVLYIQTQINPTVSENVVGVSSTSTITVTEATSTEPGGSGDRIAAPATPNTPEVVTAPATITGKLTEVNTGCFSDGICYAMVDGTKVILLRGWYQGKVGQIIGADGIGGLESHIGATVTVSAGKNTDGEFTLLGSEAFFIKVATTSKPVTGGVCAVGGCSSQLCGEAADMKDMVTTCEYREAYACYQTAKCERQATGKCGWTETNELAMCLKKAS